MANRSVLNLCEAFAAHLRYTDATRRRMELLFGRNEIVRKDIEFVYAGLFLDAFTSFERLLEDAFVGLLSGKVTHRLKRVRAKVHFQSEEIAWDIVVGKRYADWLPYNMTEERAGIFFSQGAPFSGVSKDDKKKLEAWCALRNVLAHKSYHSMRQFEKKVLSGLTLLPTERTPVGFLRSAYTSASPATRYEEAITDLLRIARSLS